MFCNQYVCIYINDIVDVRNVYDLCHVWRCHIVCIYLSTQVAFYFWNYEFVFLESTTIWGSGFLCGTSQPNLDPKYP